MPVLFVVRDSGIGISAEQQRTIFQEFSQADESTSRRFGGSGLGLTISNQLVALMGGSLQLESRPEHGSTFSFVLQLPCSEQELPNAGQQGLSEEPVAWQGSRVLLAEDEEVNRIVAEAILAKYGYQVFAASTGKEAVKIYAEEEIDLILMDLQMPVMDGFAATKEIRHYEQQLNRPAIPIIALTAHAMAEYRQRSLAAGMNGYITKPIDETEMVQAINGVLSATAGS